MNLIFSSNEKSWPIPRDIYLSDANVVIKDPDRPIMPLHIISSWSEFVCADQQSWSNVCLHITSPSLVEIYPKPAKNKCPVYTNTYTQGTYTYVNYWILFYKSGKDYGTFKLVTVQYDKNTPISVWFGRDTLDGIWIDAKKCQWINDMLQVYVCKTSHTLSHKSQNVTININKKNISKIMPSNNKVVLTAKIIPWELMEYKGKWGLSPGSSYTPNYEPYYNSPPDVKWELMQFSTLIIMYVILFITIIVMSMTLRHKYKIYRRIT